MGKTLAEPDKTVDLDEGAAPDWLQIAEVDAGSVEQMIEANLVGARIKQLRLKRSMGLVELGNKTGLSASFLSQLETGRVVPTLRNLARLGLVFHKDLSYFFQPHREGFFRVQRKRDRVRIPQPRATNPSHLAESFGILVPDRSLGPCIAEFFPNRDATPFRPHLYQGHEMVYLISGSLDIEFGSKRDRLEAGDAAYFDAGTARVFRVCRGAVRDGADYQYAAAVVKDTHLALGRAIF